MTTQSQQQRMAQPETGRAGDTGSASTQGGASDGFVGAACGAGAGAAMIWQPVTVKGGGSQDRR
ncbi:hypothetical protein [Azospirillum doebereinerae]